MKKITFLFINLCFLTNLIAQNTGEKMVLPVEVLGAEGTIEERTFTLTAVQLAKADLLWVQANNLGYQNKASVQVNDQDWIHLNHNSVSIQSPEKERGGMVHGGHSTIRFSLPITGLVSGLNVIKFRFNISDAISNGYRIVKFNFQDINHKNILDDSFFEDDDPSLWTGPYTDAASIQAGKDLWYYADLESNYLEPEKKGFWYGYELKGKEPINAKCTSCHTQDGRDLEMFSYSNKSIIERSKFHDLTEEEGKLVASYIRSLSDEKDNVGRYGRPWNPPYQPGPELANRPIEEWAAGAGLDAVLEADKDMLPYMFPNGVNQEEVYDRFDSDKMVDRTLLPVAIQFPDWKHWLPIIHPMDAYTKNDYWNDPVAQGGRSTIFPKKGYEYIRKYLQATPPVNRKPNELMNRMSDFWYHYRFFLADGRDDNNIGGHWRERNGTATQNLGDDVPRELAATSLARLMGVQYFEIMNEFDLQDKAHWFTKPEDQPASRQWFGKKYQVFEIPPHFQACVPSINTSDGGRIEGICNNFYGQSSATGAYESTNWYQVQLVINGGNGMVESNSPMDYNYHPDFIMKASGSSGIYEPLRYYHSMNAMYQFRSWSGATTPNNGNGFRIRIQGPWHIIGRSDSHQLNGFPAAAWPTFLDRIEPGLTKWVLNAQLRQFLTEVRKPENSLATWNRLPNGGSNELDAISKTTANLRDMRSAVTLDYWADKMYYLFPEFSSLGVDCQILEEMVDWCEEAWPNIDWTPFRSTGELQLNMEFKTAEDCDVNSSSVIAQVTNEGDNPIYEWWVNDEKVSNDTNELDTSEIKPGALVRSRVTSSKSCVSSDWIESELIVPDNGFKLKVRKNGSAWEDMDNTIACLDDSIEMKIEPELQEPLFWLDAMDIQNDGTEPAEGSAIPKWYNKSSSGFLMPNQSNISLRPTYNKTGMNGLPALMFGTNDADGLELFPANNGDVLNEDWTMIVACKVNYRSSGWNSMLGNESGSTGFGFHISDKGRTRSKFNGNEVHGRNYDYGDNYVLMITKEGEKIKIYINGKIEEEFAASRIKMATSRAFYLGQIDGGNPNAGWYQKGPISEVLFYDYIIPNSQKNYIEGYLAHKWKFSNQLPQDQVYRENSPLYLNLQTPEGNTLVFNKNSEINTINLDINEKFGDYSFSRFNCEATNTLFNITNTGVLGDEVVKYSINNGKYRIGNQVLVSEGHELELLPNYNFTGGFQWEEPDGTLLALNENPEKFIVSDSDIQSVWKFYVLEDASTCIVADQVYDIALIEGNLSTEINVKDNFKAYPNPTRGLVNVVIPGSGLQEVSATVYNALQQKVSERNYKLTGGKIAVSLNDVPLGIYFIRLNVESPVILKIVKQ